MLFILNYGMSLYIMLYIRVNSLEFMHLAVVLCCDSEKVKSWVQAHYTGKVISIPGKPVHVDFIMSVLPISSMQKSRQQTKWYVSSHFLH